MVCWLGRYTGVETACLLWMVMIIMVSIIIILVPCWLHCACFLVGGRMFDSLGSIVLYYCGGRTETERATEKRRNTWNNNKKKRHHVL